MRRIIPIAALAAVALLLYAFMRRESEATPPAMPSVVETATFAGGCFWCMVPPFEKLPGVVRVSSGYTGGEVANPDYERVSAGESGHRESVEILFDPRVISYGKLLDVFWHNVDPTDNGGQFCDRGSQYRSGIFVHDATQLKLAEDSKRRIEAVKKWKVMTDIQQAGKFYPAEEYHQDYYRKNPLRYKFYRLNCGRDARLARLWGRAPESHE